MTNKHIVNIHGKKYMTVAGRVELAQEKEDKLTIRTKIEHDDEKKTIVKALVITSKGEFTGHATSNKASQGIEGKSPLEVAETSAVGRALGFAGYGLISGVASADEVSNAVDDADKAIK